MKNTKVYIFALVVLFVCGMTIRWRQEAHLNSVLHELNQESTTILSASREMVEMDPKTVDRVRVFDKAWMERDRRDVSEDIEKFLLYPNANLRLKAIKRLGELEKPKSENDLSQLLPKLTGLEAVATKLAIARIQSRSTSGIKRMEHLSKSVNLSWSEVIKLSAKVNTIDRRQFDHGGLAGYEIIKTIVDVLYTMGKKGEDITSLANSLTLLPHQKLKIQRSQVSREAEIDLLMEYIRKLRVVDAPIPLRDDLLDLGQPARDRVIKQIEDVKQHPQLYRNGRGYTVLFEVAEKANDQRAIPLLKALEADQDRWLKHYASISKAEIEKRVKFNMTESL